MQNNWVDYKHQGNNRKKKAKGYLNGVVKSVMSLKITMKTLSGRKMLILSTTAAVVQLSSLHLNIITYYISRYKKQLEQKIGTEAEKITYKSRNPSTIVWISSDTVSLEKKGTTGSDEQEHKDKIQLTIET